MAVNLERSLDGHPHDVSVPDQVHVSVVALAEPRDLTEGKIDDDHGTHAAPETAQDVHRRNVRLCPRHERRRHRDGHQERMSLLMPPRRCSTPTSACAAARDPRT